MHKLSYMATAARFASGGTRCLNWSDRVLEAWVLGLLRCNVVSHGRGKEGKALIGRITEWEC